MFLIIKDCANGENPNDEEYCVVQLLRDLPVPEPVPAVAEERLPLQGKQLPVRSRQARREAVIEPDRRPPDNFGGRRFADIDNYPR